MIVALKYSAFSIIGSFDLHDGTCKHNAACAKCDMRMKYTWRMTQLSLELVRTYKNIPKNDGLSR